VSTYLGLILATITAAAQVGGGLAALNVKNFPHKWERILLALGAGFLIALVFVELIPESFHLTQDHDTSVIIMLIGFSALHFFEHTIVEHFHFGEETHAEHSHVPHSSLFGAVGGLTLHAFFDGMAISSIASAEAELGILIAIAVMLHKIPEGLTVSSVMLAGHRSKKEAKQATYLLGIATIAGALITFFFIAINREFIGYLFAFSAGAALYVGACDLIPEINKTRGRVAPLLVFLGILLFYLGSLLIGHDH
jgi:zinc transporter ZupT